MRDVRQSTPYRGLARFGMLFLAALSTGCSSGGGNPLGFLQPSNNRLLESAKSVKSAYPDPLELPRELDKRALASYVVEPGDVLLVQPLELDSPVRLPGDQPVLPDGTINLGKYGRPIVAGRTLPEIEGMVRASVESGGEKNPGFVSVRLITRQSKVYYVLGEVNSPGALQLQGRETVLDAILAAGGLTERAALDKIILSRPTPPPGCRVVIPICYREIVQLGDTSTNYQILPGDRIFVPSKTLMESLCGPKDKTLCPPCGRPQVPCPTPNCGEHLLGKPVSAVVPPPAS